MFQDTGDRQCIKQVIDMLKPEVVIPIHGEQPEKIKELTDKAVILQDRRNIRNKVKEQNIMNLNLNQIKEISMNRLKELYGDNIDQAILKRYNEEMEIIYKQEWESLFMVAHLITKKMKEDNQIIKPIGLTGSLFVAYLLGISYINPIDYNIPYETFIGTHGEKEPVIELRVGWKYLISPLRGYAEKLLGREKVIATVLSNYIKLELQINDNLRISMIGGDFPTKLRYLEEITGVSHNDININDNEILKLLEMKDISEILGYKSNVGKQIYTEINPQTLEHLVKAYALLHGTGVWDNNVENLIKTHSIKELPCSREDIFLYLNSKGIEKETSYKIMEFVRKGKFAKANADKHLLETWRGYTEIIQNYNIPEWYIKSLEKIKYMFPMAHSYNVIILDLYIAWYKLHYPNEYEQVMKVFDLKTKIESEDINYDY